MPYPLVIAVNGDMIARINPDVSWAVQWPGVLDAAYRKPTPRSMAMRAYANLLLAARDNFIVTPWHALTADWQHYEAVIDHLDLDPVPGNLSVITFNGKTIARVNYDGTWSVLWYDVLEVARWEDFDYRATALIGICRMLQAAKDRFVVTPWRADEDDV